MAFTCGGMAFATPGGLEFGTNLSTGTDFTTNLAGTTAEQRAEMPGYLDNLATDKLTGFLAQDPYGYEIDPVTLLFDTLRLCSFFLRTLSSSSSSSQPFAADSPSPSFPVVFSVLYVASAKV